MTSRGLIKKVEQVFAQDGVISKATPNYQTRKSQVEFAKSVANAMIDKKSIVVEAGTGTGKTFAYLVPALLHGGKVLISTAGKTLQDQLYTKDIPVLLRSLKMGARVALLKGRSNYICRARFERAYEENVAKSREEVVHLNLIKDYLHTAKTGEKSELTEVPEYSGIWPAVTSNAENCLGRSCPDYENCFVMRAREKAKEADILVINHHLFLADISLRDNDITDFLPEFDLIVLDEAHQLPSIATDFFSDTLSLGNVRSLAEDCTLAGSTNCPKAANWTALASHVVKACDDIVLKIKMITSQDDIKTSISNLKDAHLLAEPFEGLVKAFNELANTLEDNREISPEMSTCADRVQLYLQTAKKWYKIFDQGQEGEEGKVCWLTTRGRQVLFNETPLVFSDSFRKARLDQGKPWVLTSATLSTRDKQGSPTFKHFTDQMGLDDAQTFHWDSPFDYRNQAMLYIPPDLPLPSANDFSESVATRIWPFIQENGGRTFVLCTTIKAMETIAEQLRYYVERARSSIKVLLQKEKPRKALLREFREHGNAVLVGSMSFWEGVDIKGDTLSLVVIDKIPFSPPDDPVTEGKSRWLKSQNKSAFYELSLPEATMLLMQGAGRLIRDENDRGLLIICDKRVINSSYGEMIWKSLPDFSRTTNFDGAMKYLKSLKA